MIYTAVTNEKDKPRTDVKCFSEYDRFKDPRLNAKIYKILSHQFIDSEWSVWIDGNLKLKVTEKDLIEMTKPYDVGVFRHPWRDCLYEEANECQRLGLDDSNIIEEQIKRYRDAGCPKNSGLGACFLIVRRHTPKVCQFNEEWWAEICRGSVRDQISFPYVFGEDVKYFPRQINIKNNDFFRRKVHLK